MFERQSYSITKKWVYFPTSLESIEKAGSAKSRGRVPYSAILIRQRRVSWNGMRTVLLLFSTRRLVDASHMQVSRWRAPATPTTPKAQNRMCDETALFQRKRGNARKHLKSFSEQIDSLHSANDCASLFSAFSRLLLLHILVLLSSLRLLSAERILIGIGMKRRIRDLLLLIVQIKRTSTDLSPYKLKKRKDFSLFSFITTNKRALSGQEWKEVPGPCRVKRTDTRHFFSYLCCSTCGSQFMVISTGKEYIINSSPSPSEFIFVFGVSSRDEDKRIWDSSRKGIPDRLERMREGIGNLYLPN